MFTHLQSVAAHFENNKEVIAQTWVERESVKHRLLAHAINPDFFARHFGVRVIGYAMGVIAGRNELGNCPVVHVMLEFFKKKQIPLHDLFIVCAGLKTTFILLAHDHEMLSESFINQITDLMDRNFEGVMVEYTKMDRAVCHPVDPQECPSCDVFIATQKTMTSDEFRSSTSFDTDKFSDLKDLESDALELLDCDSLAATQKEMVVQVFIQYHRILEQLEEFAEIETSLLILIEIIQEVDFENFDLRKQEMITIFLRELIEHFSQWRGALFGQYRSDDIHWMDGELVSLMAQLEIILSPDKNGSFESVDLF